jgi:hypothetical protein
MSAVYVVTKSEALGENISDEKGKRLFSCLSQDEVVLTIKLLKSRDTLTRLYESGEEIEPMGPVRAVAEFNDAMRQARELLP